MDKRRRHSDDRFWPHAGLLAIVAMSAACHGQRPPAHDLTLVEELRNPERRNAAFCELVRRGKYRGQPSYRESVEDGCVVNHVVEAPQPDGTSVFVVFRNANPEAFPLAATGVPKGPFALVASDGAFVPVFSSANVLDADDALFSYDGAGRLAIAHRSSYGPSGSPWSVEMLHIVPVTPEQRPMLSVIVGPPSIGFMPDDTPFAWTWGRQDSKPGAAPVIVLGPRGADGTITRVAATYRFDPSSGSYEGPEGGVDEGFERVRLKGSTPGCCTDERRAIESWAYQFVRSPKSFTSPLPVVFEHRQVQQDENWPHEEPSWPRVGDAAPRVKIPTTSTCALASADLSYDDWKAHLTAPSSELLIPVDVLQRMAQGGSIHYEVQDACGGSTTSSVSIP